MINFIIMTKIIKTFDHHKTFTICNVSHSYVNMTPFTNPINNNSDFISFYPIGKIEDISNFEIDKEYSDKEFNILLKKNKINKLYGKN